MAGSVLCGRPQPAGLCIIHSSSDCVYDIVNHINQPLNNFSGTMHNYKCIQIVEFFFARQNSEIKEQRQGK